MKTVSEWKCIWGLQNHVDDGWGECRPVTHQITQYMN